MEKHQERETPSSNLRRRDIPSGLGISSLPSHDVTDGSCLAERTVQRDHRCWVDDCLNSRCYADVCSENGQACQPSVEPGASLPRLLVRVCIRRVPVLLHSSRIPHKSRTLSNRQRYRVCGRDLDAHAVAQKSSQDSEQCIAGRGIRTYYGRGELSLSSGRRIERLSTYRE